ncbi:hypothetical protein ES703_108671 [subsurface metagenome]
MTAPRETIKAKLLAGGKEPNIFRQANQLIKETPYGEFTDDEAKLIATATAFVANELPKVYPDVLTMSEGLLLLAEITEEETPSTTAS